MTEHKIDFELALAIGYAPDRVRLRIYLSSSFVQVLNDYSRCDGPIQYGGWQRFDHTDSDVFRHVAERFECFPRPCGLLRKQWSAGYSLSCEVLDDCAATASALAVIRYFEGKA